VKAVVRYGASKSTHRVDDVVSGRTTPICSPDPADVVSPLSVDIVDAMSTVKELTLSPEGTVPLVAGLDEVPALDEAAGDAGVVAVDVDDEHPAATIAAAAAAATRPSRDMDLNGPWPCDGEGRPPRPLLPSCIPDPFRHNALARSDTPMRDTAQRVCPYRMKGRSCGYRTSRAETHP
jgi:hypothetical protein